MERAAVSLHIPTTAAGTDDSWYIAWPFAGTWKLDVVEFTPATAVPIDGTDTVVSTIAVNAGSGTTGSTSWTTVCSHTTFTGGTALVLGTTVEPTVTPGTLVKGRQIRVISTHAGAGKVLDGTYTFSAEKVN